MSCELTVGTNGSNTKETFLSVPVLRKVFLSGNQPLKYMLNESQEGTVGQISDRSGTKREWRMEKYTEGFD